MLEAAAIERESEGIIGGDDGGECGRCGWMEEEVRELEREVGLWRALGGRRIVLGKSPWEEVGGGEGKGVCWRGDLEGG